MKRGSSLVIKFVDFGQGVLNKDPTIWLDGARPANTCIPPSFPGNVPVQPSGAPTKKYVWEYMKMDVCEYKRKYLSNLTATLQK